MFVAWHLGGMAYRDYLELTMPEREALLESLKDLIERHGAEPQPKDLRK